MPFAGNCPDRDCPPPDAHDVHGEIIRFVKHAPPTADDMKTWADEGKAGAPAWRVR